MVLLLLPVPFAGIAVRLLLLLVAMMDDKPVLRINRLLNRFGWIIAEEIGMRAASRFPNKKDTMLRKVLRPKLEAGG